MILKDIVQLYCSLLGTLGGEMRSVHKYLDSKTTSGFFPALKNVDIHQINAGSSQKENHQDCEKNVAFLLKLKSYSCAWPP